MIFSTRSPCGAAGFLRKTSKANLKESFLFATERSIESGKFLGQAESKQCLSEVAWFLLQISCRMSLLSLLYS